MVCTCQEGVGIGCTNDLLPENVILTDEGGKDLVLRRKTQVLQQRDPHLPCGGARVAFAQDDGPCNRSFVDPGDYESNRPIGAPQNVGFLLRSTQPTD
jgi:hypothetical protein